MGAAEIMALIVQAAQLVQTLIAESRAATPEEQSTLWDALEAQTAQVTAQADAAEAPYKEAPK
jgi:hypothetical protein